MVTVVEGDATILSTVRIDITDQSQHSIATYHVYTESLTIELNSNGSGGRLPIEAGTARIVPCIGCRDL